MKEEKEKMRNRGAGGLDNGGARAASEARASAVCKSCMCQEFCGADRKDAGAGIGVGRLSLRYQSR